MTITAHATSQLAPLTVYVIGIDSRDDNAIGPADAAFGIYFDSARLASFNSSGAFHSTKKYSAGDQQALFKVRRSRLSTHSTLRLTTGPRARRACRASGR